MTTSISSVAVNQNLEVGESAPAPVEVINRVPHTLASRFIFLGLCMAIVLTALAFGTNHNWALAIFNLGALAIVFLWIVDGWKLDVLRISRNPLQLALLGMLLLGLVQLLPLRSPAAADLTEPAPGRGSLVRAGGCCPVPDSIEGSTRRSTSTSVNSCARSTS